MWVNLRLGMIQLSLLLLNFIVNRYLLRTTGDCWEPLGTATWRPPAVQYVRPRPEWSRTDGTAENTVRTTDLTLYHQTHSTQRSQVHMTLYLQVHSNPCSQLRSMPLHCTPDPAHSKNTELATAQVRLGRFTSPLWATKPPPVLVHDIH